MENCSGRFVVSMTKEMELQKVIIKVENYNGKSPTKMAKKMELKKIYYESGNLKSKIYYEDDFKVWRKNYPDFSSD